MKKLIIISALVCAAAFANAATYNWNVSTTAGYELPGPSSSSKVDGTLYMFVYSEGFCTQELIWNAVRGDGSIDDFASYGANKTLTVTAGAVVPDDAKKYARITTTVESGSEVSKQTLFVVIKDGDNYFFDDEAQYSTMITDDGTPVVFDHSWAGDTQFDFTAGGASQAWNTTGWYNAAPEPTSGLLLLFGLAGLALKRKRV